MLPRRTTTLAYDTRSILSSITGPSGARVTFTNNSAGQPVTVTDPLGNTTVFSYNSGDLVGIADPLHHSSSRIADGAGRLLSITDPLGHRIRYEYDASSLLTRLVDALGASTTFAYDANGNLTGITDARGNLTAYAYDVMDRLISRTDPLLRTQTYATAQDGKVTSYQYDARNRPTFAGYGTVTLGGTTTYESTTTYTYDAGNRLTQVVDSLAGTTTFAYNDLDQITSIISPQGTVTYAYDAVGRRTRMTVAGQPDVTYSYDSRDRVTQIARGTSVVGFVYDADGRRTTLTLPNGITVQYSYDNDSRLTSITYQNGAAVLGDLNYGYDSAERRHMTTVVRPTRSTHKGTSLGSNMIYVIDITAQDGKEVIVPIHPEDYQLRTFKHFSLTKESLASKDSLEQYLQKQSKEGKLPCRTIAVYDLQSWRAEAREIPSETIRAEYFNPFQFYVLGRLATKYHDWRIKRENKRRLRARKPA